MFFSNKNLECFRASFSHSLILFSRTAAYAHGACTYCARSFVEISNAREVKALLMEMSILPIPRTVHPGMRNKVAAFVDNRNVHGLLDFSSLLFGSGDSLTCFSQGHQ